jgi:hypothetical protein
VEKIAELEKEYDFTDVSVKECEEAKKWYKADKPTSSCMYGPTVASVARGGGGGCDVEGRVEVEGRRVLRGVVAE